MQQLPAADANALSVRVELQADCLAGVWAKRTNSAHDFIEAGDVEEALNAASAIGDDRLQGQAGGTVSPDSFTHGSSAQRAHWFRTGLQGGTIESCNTFKAGGV
jgi:predicted metalloprotease